jgi:hypothetical protein
MMQTPIPVRWLHETTVVVVCDVCGKAINVGGDIGGMLTLPAPWRRVGVPRWVGMLDVCSEECDRRIRNEAGSVG